MQEIDLIRARWRTSSYSSGNGQCVEIAVLPEVVATRDSTNPSGPTLLFPTASWSTFIAAVKGGELSGA